jgi:hypothetical protein
MARKPRIKRMEVLVHPHCSSAGMHHDASWRRSIDELAKDPHAGMVIFTSMRNSGEEQQKIFERRKALAKYAKNALNDRVIITSSPKKIESIMRGRGIETAGELRMTAYGMYGGNESLCVSRYGKAARDVLKASKFDIDEGRSVIRKLK